MKMLRQRFIPGYNRVCLTPIGQKQTVDKKGVITIIEDFDKLVAFPAPRAVSGPSGSLKISEIIISATEEEIIRRRKIPGIFIIMPPETDQFVFRPTDINEKKEGKRII